jgi:DNA-directed RNA polymerase subunit RPC12/RpoP
MSEEMRTFGYLCPKCGKPVVAARSIFALEASNAEVACVCGGSALRAEFDGEKYQISVPCGLCGEIHTAVCSAQQVTGGGGVGLACTKTKQLCCFIGPEAAVRNRLRELTILAEKEKQHQEEPEAFADSVIMYEVLSELKEIAARKDGITCGCGSRRCGMEIRRSAVDLVCRDCGAKLRIPAATDEDLDALCCHIKLVIPGKRT